MAEIAAFRGIVYDPSRARASDVLAPPYDVIDHAGREELAARHPKNCVRLILPEGDGGDRYQSGARTLDAWLTEGVLRRDDRPALYRYEQVFASRELGGRTVTRRGVVAAVKLHRFEDGVILPHERTLPGPKLDRLELMRATRAQLSQVFALYSDRSREVEQRLTAAEADEPALDGTTDDGTRHRMWRVTDEETVRRVAEILAPKRLTIADGHHRYETMLAFRDELDFRVGGLAPRSTAAFGTLFLASADDPGLVVLPTHRLVRGLSGVDPDRLLAAAGEHLDVTWVTGGARDADALREALADSGRERPTWAAVFPGREDAALMALRRDFDPAAAGLEGSPALTRLDVTLLHELVLSRLLGIGRAADDAQAHLGYVKGTEDALARIRAGEGQVCFVMNPTPVSHVFAVADAGEVMPQKSTFFYPKLASGVVIYPVRPDETL